MFRLHKGRPQNFRDLGPPPTLVRIFARSINVYPRNLPYHVCFRANPPSPLGVDVLYEWSLRGYPNDRKIAS